MKFIVAAILFISQSVFAVGLQIENYVDDPTVDKIDGSWVAEIIEIIPMNRVYIRKPRLELNAPVMEQSVFNLGLTADAGNWICKHFGYGEYIDRPTDESGAFTGKQYIAMKYIDERAVFNFEKTKEDSDTYYLTAVCNLKDPE